MFHIPHTDVKKRFGLGPSRAKREALLISAMSDFKNASAAEHLVYLSTSYFSRPMRSAEAGRLETQAVSYRQSNPTFVSPDRLARPETRSRRFEVTRISFRFSRFTRPTSFRVRDPVSSLSLSAISPSIMMSINISASSNYQQLTQPDLTFLQYQQTFDHVVHLPRRPPLGAQPGHGFRRRLDVHQHGPRN